ncbi:hypothetical protein ACIQWR_13875 [Streptomyces sp. NPDC098789]|uniref:hypothetical protein n=1 Tax=Streptomyces sp. NPDC098789 TaxID=3366098 RepID=UPI003830E546
MSTAAVHTTFASPLTLLHQWDEKTPLLEFLLLGFTVDLPFLEKVALPVARGLGARVAVLGDARHGLYHPVDVHQAGRGYLHGLASVHGAFHPKVALLFGEHACRIAVGSGNPTPSGWGANDELWTVVETEDDASHPVLADLADWLEQLAGSPDVSLAPWWSAHLRTIAWLLEEHHVEAPAGPVEPGGARLLHNLDRPLIDQLPRGPVDELHLYAPFVDPSGGLLRPLVDRFDPADVVLGLQPRWSSYDSDVIKGAFAGRTAAVRSLAESRSRHGKFIEWRADGVRYSLTGSPNLTAAALGRTVARGNCELAVLTPGGEPLLPEAVSVAPAEQLTGRTVRIRTESRASLVLLGARTDGLFLEVHLAAPAPGPVRVDSSRDGTPGSWTAIGEIAPQERGARFPLDGRAPGSVLRAAYGGAVSAPVFLYSPEHCARVGAADTSPRLGRPYTVEELFTDPRAARRFEEELDRLRELLATAPRTAAAISAPALLGTSLEQGRADRWSAYLTECRLMIGAPLTELALGRAYFGLPELPKSTPWSVSAVTAGYDDESDGDEQGDEGDGEPRGPLPPEHRAWLRTWIARQLPRLRRSGPPLVPLTLAGLYVQLMAAGAWDATDYGWRGGLATLVDALTEGAQEAEEAPELTQRRAAVLAVLMSLLGLHGEVSGPGAEPLAAGAWARAREAVARADPDDARDLLLPAGRPGAPTVAAGDLEAVIGRAGAADDPWAEVREELARAGLDARYDDGLWEVTGRSGSTVRVATKAVSLLGEHLPGTVLVRAGSRSEWTFAAWNAPDLVLFTKGMWRTYAVRSPGTPASRFSTDGLSGVLGHVRPDRRAVQGPPPVLEAMLGAPLDPAWLRNRLFPLPGPGLGERTVR